MARRLTTEIRVRARPETKNRIELAARVTGRTLSEIVRESARAEADRILNDLDAEETDD